MVKNQSEVALNNEIISCTICIFWLHSVLLIKACFFFLQFECNKVGSSELG